MPQDYVVVIGVAIEYWHTAGRRWTRTGFDDPVHANAVARRSWWRRLLNRSLRATIYRTRARRELFAKDRDN